MTTSTENEAPLGALRSGAETHPVLLRQRRSWRQRLRMPLMLGGPILVVLAALYWYLTGGRYVATDDAYVQAARVQISTDIAGRVAEINVHDNQVVSPGQTLFRLDPRPFRIAVAQAKAQLAATRLEIEALKATYQQKQSDVKGAETTLAYDQRELERQQRLLATGAASQSAFDKANHDFELARERLASARNDLANVLASLGGDPALPTDQHPKVLGAQAALDRAELNLSYTEVHAPEQGIVTKVDQLQVGDYVNAATPLFSLMSTQKVWVEANFKETELTHMRPGQTATISIDTYPDQMFEARVQSLSPGTGLTFSLLPAENATGNWVKVVQRLPVRLTIDKLDPQTPLHAGLSATVEVDTGYHRPWRERLERMFAWITGPPARGAPTK